jgi:hypothetical protein
MAISLSGPELYFKAVNLPIQKGVRIYPKFLAYRTAPQHSVYRSKN